MFICYQNIILVSQALQWHHHGCRYSYFLVGFIIDQYLGDKRDLCRASEYPHPEIDLLVVPFALNRCALHFRTFVRCQDSFDLQVDFWVARWWAVEGNWA